MSEAAKKPLDAWAEELHQRTLRLGYKLRRTLYSGESDFQRVDVVETESFGRMLFNDSVVMLSERDEWVYHEMISHPAMFVHPGVKRALVVGGGDGGTVRELLRHPSVEHCRLVEIDPLVVEACREHLTVTAKALDDPRVEVTIADGVAFVADTDQRYDLVVVDSTDPVGPAKPLFGEKFYADVSRVLEPDGLVVSQAESPFYMAQEQRGLLKILRAGFRRVHLYNYSNITYPGGLWSFSMAMNADRCPIENLDVDRLRGSGLEFRYYGESVHRAAFVLPAFQQANLASYLTPFKTDPLGSPSCG